MSEPPPVTDADRARMLARESASWLASVILHVLLIVILASIVLAGRPEKVIETRVQLIETPRPADEAQDESGEGGASGGAPSLDEASDRTRSDATAAPLPSVPQPAASGAPAPSAAALNSMNPALTDPAFAVLAELAEAPAAERTVGQGVNPLLSGTSRGFRDMVGGLGASGLDVVIVLDATESMGPSIAQAKQRIRDVIGVITGVLTVDDRPPDNVRFGAVAFKDYGDEYGVEAARAQVLTGDFEAVRAFIDEIFVSGGGDIPEPVNEALAIATDERMGWKKNRRSVIVLVGDAPVHPSGRQAALDIARRFTRLYEGAVSALDVSHERTHVLADFGEIARAGNGAAFRIDDDERFWMHLIVSIFGERYEKDVEHIVARYVEQQGADAP